MHYQPNDSAEWASLFPAGSGGFVRLGPARRPFGFALFHQMHCLVRIRRAMATRHLTGHVHHCFNYLRQAILCEANPAVEPVIPILGRRSVNAEIPHTCRDWSQVYAFAEANYNASISELGERADEVVMPEYV